MSKVIGKEISMLIKTEREKQGLTKSELAKKAGVTVRAIEYWENGKRTITEIDAADKVLKALGVTFVLGGKYDG